MSRIRAAGATDTGMVRKANEDAFYRGETVFAVADGMGGHLAGEVASSMALEPVEALDGHVFADASTATQALVDSIETANRAVSRKAAEEPSYRGMGTTLTAVLIAGRRIHVGHVGDSRAYLYRDGDLRQLTDDHTLVQHLIDEGQITKEEAATHPQRSIITRAVGVGREVDVDAMSFELQEGDMVLICSDGLTGVVPDDELSKELAEERPLEHTVQRLIELANAGGGHDNITALLLCYGEPVAAPPVSDGAAAGLEGSGDRRVIVRTDDEANGTDWAQRLGRFGSLGREQDSRFDDESPGPARWRRWGAALLGVVIVLGLLFGGARWLLGRSYYVGVADDHVAIYQGIPAEVGPVELSWVEQRTDLALDDLPDFRADAFQRNVTAVDLADARRIVESAREDARSRAASPSPDTASPGPSPSPGSPTP